MAIDKVVIQGAEFTRVAERYLLQSEVERAMAQAPASAPHLERLTNLLEDIVNAADRIALEVIESSEAGLAHGMTAAGGAPDVLVEIRRALREQITAIDRHLTGETS